MSRMPWSWLSNGRSAKSQVEKRISADPKAFELTDIRPQMGLEKMSSTGARVVPRPRSDDPLASCLPPASSCTGGCVRLIDEGSGLDAVVVDVAFP